MNFVDILSNLMDKYGTRESIVFDAFGDWRLTQCGTSIVGWPHWDQPWWRECYSLSTLSQSRKELLFRKLMLRLVLLCRMCLA